MHAERGNANVAELLAILERIRPEVIFLELPAEAVEKFIHIGATTNMESTAVRHYQERHRVELVPVDIRPPDEAFFSDYQRLQAVIDNNSRDSRRLLTWHRNYIREYGFTYLNSENCSKMFSDICSDEAATLNVLGDPSLMAISEQWRRIIETREIEMMKNIHEYCRHASFGRGVFLIGAAHRQSIIHKSRQYSGDTQYGVQWDISCGNSF